MIVQLHIWFWWRRCELMRLGLVVKSRQNTWGFIAFRCTPRMEELLNRMRAEQPHAEHAFIPLPMNVSVKSNCVKCHSPSLIFWTATVANGYSNCPWVHLGRHKPPVHPRGLYGQPWGFGHPTQQVPTCTPISKVGLALTIPGHAHHTRRPAPFPRNHRLGISAIFRKITTTGSVIQQTCIGKYPQKEKKQKTNP